MKRLMTNERGNVLATAMLLISAMMMIGLATISIADNQTGQSRKQRERESTFNLTEGVLTSQTFVLGRNGTGSSGLPFPDQCTPTTTNLLCPKPEELARSFDGATQKDFAAGTDWQTSVRDNRAPGSAAGSKSDFYDPTLTYDPAVPATSCNASSTDHIDCYDGNADDKLWVRASSNVRGRVRTIVALIQVERRPITLPQFAVLAGSFQTSNNGRKVIVDTTGSQVSVRCTLSGGQPASGDPCLGYDPGKGQLDPPGSYLTGQPTQAAVVDDDLLALEDSARGAGTYYASCPSNPNGKIVYVKTGNCSYNNSAPAATGQSKCCNSTGTPGLYILESGTLSINGDIEFHGVVYAANKQNSSGTVVTTGGTSLILGGVIVDGDGRVTAGSSGLNIDFDANAFTGISTTGTAGVVQNTWRELPAD